MNNDNDESQVLSEKYRAKKRNKRTLSVEEYRSRMSKDLLSIPKEKDSISDLLKDDSDVDRCVEAGRRIECLPKESGDLTSRTTNRV